MKYSHNPYLFGTSIGFRNEGFPWYANFPYLNVCATNTGKCFSSVFIKLPTITVNTVKRANAILIRLRSIVICYFRAESDVRCTFVGHK